MLHFLSLTHAIFVSLSALRTATQLTVSKVLAYVELVYNTRQKRLAGEAQRQALLEKGQELHELTALEKVSACVVIFL